VTAPGTAVPFFSLGLVLILSAVYASAHISGALSGAASSTATEQDQALTELSFQLVASSKYTANSQLMKSFNSFLTIIHKHPKCHTSDSEA